MQSGIDDKLYQIMKLINAKIDRAELDKINKDIQLQITEIIISISKCADKDDNARRFLLIDKQVRNSK